MKKRENGFSLIELILVIAILGVLFLGMVFVFDPAGQINKAKDTQRENDLTQIQRALDTYFNDTGCYPLSLTFGSPWSIGSTKYMIKVPQEPDYYGGGRGYVYQTDSSSCPQWNVLYADLKQKTLPANSCALQAKSSCVPANFTNKYNFCVVSGLVDCTVISASSIDGGVGGYGGDSPTNSPGGGGGTGTPTPTPLVCPNDNYYGCTGDNRCNSMGIDQNTHLPTQCSDYGGSITCYCDRHCNQQCTFN